MKCIFVMLGDRHFDGSKNSLVCAVNYSGAEVIHISNVNYGVGTFVPAEKHSKRVDRLLASSAKGLGVWSLCQWMVLLDYMEDNGLDEPVFVPDWDVMIFQDIAHAIEPFKDCDFYAPKMSDCVWSGAHGVKGIGILQEAERQMIGLIKEHPSVDYHTCNAMTLWARMAMRYPNRVGNMNQVIDGAYFDPNIATGHELFEMDHSTVTSVKPPWNHPAKRIVWKTGKPHFVLQGSGGLVKANIIHCWGPFKTKTGELLKYATEGRNDQ